MHICTESLQLVRDTNFVKEGKPQFSFESCSSVNEDFGAILAMQCLGYWMSIIHYCCRRPEHKQINSNGYGAAVQRRAAARVLKVENRETHPDQESLFPRT